jgi:4-hydroxybenzoyl-CoA thioesterase
VPPWRDTEKTRGIIGTPVVDISSRFVRPATYGDRIEVIPPSSNGTTRPS